MKLSEWLREAEISLRAAGIDSPAMEAQILSSHVLRVDRAWLFAHPEQEFNELAGEHLLQRRLSGEPLAYIVGWREFYGRTFGVDPSVLIPRHETESLVDAALDLGRQSPANGDLPTYEVLDLGTGSGAIAITLKLERPAWEVTAADVSAHALATASANARFLDAKVRLVLSDRFIALLGESFDMIVSNPPYIGTHEELPPEIAGHEPPQALFAGLTGLEFYELLAQESDKYLKDGGLLLVEIGHTQATSVRAIFESTGWKHVETREDLSGIERVVVLQCPFADG